MSSSRFTIAQLLTSMEGVGLIPVFNHENPAVAVEVVTAAYNGGVRCFEFTNRGDHALKVFRELVKQVQGLDGLALGAGTIMNAQQAQTFVEAGADFIVSPIFKKEIADYSHKVGQLWIPGCATLTEMVTAMDAGAQLVKVFPGSVLGPAFVSSVLPVIPSARLMPTGGVEPTLASLTAWFRAGVTCVGMGSQFFSKELTQNPAELSKRVAAVIGMIDIIRNPT